ncbi:MULTISPECIES: flagellar motor protein MotB [Pseudomonas syringae group]|uniref:Flagellar motor protein MotB n=1 Tax=Pseudomonas syringae pv. ribicola TaxID=55398 RepID=A0A0P9ZSC8_PSESI|nr:MULTISPECIES: flagellar motor protein MotB [Pseudomonas syringae group]EKN45958.1 flagellar motor protein MotB [Pseudomonas viridiflava UASWS0038]KPL64417.1 flagellar motor protein MotB [Pseudomonas viridiflava]KPY51067.1 Flagellar motor protein MotB [Pseudomonas syringae pv. ribicola]KPZ20226.1 Flagellar motor protein MotB [Pseudomonas viridiflava]MEE4070780.1 flagellar motor protein MotB [Pseudomonas viridiflava]
MENNQPIIIKRVKRFGGGHHGGAWKIAFADFATAMMAFFLVLWLMSSATPEQLIAVAGYFKDPVGFSDSGSPYVIDLGGSPEMSPNQTLNPEVKTTPSPDTVPIESDTSESKAEEVEQERLEMLLQELQNKVEENPQLQKFKDQILFEITQDGLRIQIMDADNRPMFDSGSARLKPYFEDILLAMADTIKSVPNKISISGHTDATPFVGNGGFGNWELSANRANAARRALVAGSYPDPQVARVVGYASSALYDRENPTNPVNRRIDIVVLTKKAQERIEGAQNSGGAPQAPAAPPAPGAVPGASAAPAPVDPQAYAQPHEIRQKLNIFDQGTLKVEPTQN